MNKLVVHRPTGELLVIPHSSQDMPDDGFTVAKGLTLELANIIVQQVAEFLGGNAVMVIMNPAWMVHHAVEIRTFHVQPVYDTHDVQHAANMANDSLAVHEGEGTPERVIQLLWPRTNHTFEAVHLMAASGLLPVPLAEVWAAA